MPSHALPEVIFEYLQVGNSMRVTAIDSATGMEIVFQAPINTNPSDLQKLALKKLEYVMKKQGIKK